MTYTVTVRMDMPGSDISEIEFDFQNKYVALAIANLLQTANNVMEVIAPIDGEDA